MTTLEKIKAHWPQMPTSGSSPIDVPNTDRWHSLTELFHVLGFKVGAEIGTERGLFAKRLCYTNPGVKLYCVDPWQAYSGYREHVTQSKLDNFYEIARERLASYDCHLIRKYSVEASKDFKDSSLDFVYIDANHNLLHVVQDLYAWAPKVRKDGLIAGHDFLRRNNRLRYQCHVVEGVYAYTQCHMIDPWYVLGRKEKVEGELREDVRSFMWVKS